MDVPRSWLNARVTRNPAAPRRRSFFHVLFVGAAVAGLVAAGALVAKMVIHQPFTTKIIDRTPPPVLISLQDLSQYKAASAQFEVLVDTEKDVKYLPSAIAGERTFFVGIGSVDATVDFSHVSPSNIAVSADHLSATILLPHAVMSPPVVDSQKSYVAARNRGLLNRVAGAFSDSPTNDQPLFQAAGQKMQASAEQTGLLYRAESNTRDMLTSLVRSLGYSQVVVTFSDPAAAPTS